MKGISIAVIITATLRLDFCSRVGDTFSYSLASK